MPKKAEQKTYDSIIFAQDDRFGKGALKSGKINSQQFDAFMKKFTEGGSLVLKPGYYKNGSPVENDKGQHLHFLEILPPFEKSEKPQRRTRDEDSEDEIPF